MHTSFYRFVLSLCLISCAFPVFSLRVSGFLQGPPNPQQCETSCRPNLPPSDPPSLPHSLFPLSLCVLSLFLSSYLALCVYVSLSLCPYMYVRPPSLLPISLYRNRSICASLISRVPLSLTLFPPMCFAASVPMSVFVRLRSFVCHLFALPVFVIVCLASSVQLSV